MYWAKSTRIDKIANVISRDRWKEIKSKLHCNDNSKLRRDDPNRDRLFKIRPLVDSLQETFRNLAKSEFLCIDEQIVPFKGKSGLKQYNPKNPKKLGLQIFVLCDTSGLVYDFEIYCGKIQPVAGFPDIGASSNIVLKLVDSVPRNMNHKLFFDNWFSSLPLFFELKQIGIESLGTVRSDRFKGLNFPTDKDMKHDFGRGSVLKKSHVTNTDVEIRAVKWMNNRGVVLVSSFESAQPLTNVKRFDKKVKKEILVPCPKAVITYNKFMGGVDLLDGLVAYYRISTKSKKYYMKMVHHFVDMGVVNAWLVYRRDCSQKNYPKKEIKDLLEFRSDVAAALCSQGKQQARKRGRPSLEDQEEAAYEEKKKKGPAKAPPEVDVRKDGLGHWPVVAEDRQRCKKSGCKGITTVKFNKCQVHLCLTKNRNCFSSSFHGV
ncbi:piggyBac transposable element-derived protein 3-like [Homalodisca vitripennis]|uniref:piggyBac transposable element-derived protein 3-like n=1 Tax=Homalodisca vitripennis TaxID=197043 RepID=UPI001EEB7468|nr:piggyBac transposable element-derived protein 3-like [Homalodisca vitripennis]